MTFFESFRDELEKLAGEDTAKKVFQVSAPAAVGAFIAEDVGGWVKSRKAAQRLKGATPPRSTLAHFARRYGGKVGVGAGLVGIGSGLLWLREEMKKEREKIAQERPKSKFAFGHPVLDHLPSAEEKHEPQWAEWRRGYREAKRKSLRKIALDISGDPKKEILMKQYEKLSKGLQTMPKGGPKEKPKKPPSVVYHVKVNRRSQ